MGTVMSWSYTFEYPPTPEEILKRMKEHTGIAEINLIRHNSVYSVSHANFRRSLEFWFTEAGIEHETIDGMMSYLEGAFVEVMRQSGAREPNETAVPSWAKKKWAELRWWQRIFHAN
jgi:hypothetical protein